VVANHLLYLLSRDGFYGSPFRPLFMKNMDIKVNSKKSNLTRRYAGTFVWTTKKSRGFI
jgi:hypothetical protein